ncbi:hypothetical protein BGZ63DRAFT_382641 [Mariannaea sp. PMI_226]|nr:hypothetical protein BGZ63DRAFT_382641 [Mariannaea sp. PMI_226]
MLACLSMSSRMLGEAFRPLLNPHFSYIMLEHHPPKISHHSPPLSSFITFQFLTQSKTNTNLKMQIKSLLLAPLVAAGFASAAPSKPVNFEVLALHPASGFHFEGLQAARGGFYLKLPNEKAVCSAKSDNTGTLQLIDGELQLYTTSSTKQKIFVDRSGMGQGVFRYTTSNSFPSRFERKGWKIDGNGNLNFNGAGLIACPGGISSSWTIWVNAGVANPGGNKNCLPFVARAITNSKPNSCKYTQ